jgi:hypothetical protein
LIESYSAELKEFFGVEDVATISQYELKQFILGPALELGLDISTVVDIEFYQTTFEAALIEYVGADFTQEDVINFVFGDGAPYVDVEYFKAQYGENMTEDGVMVKDLEGEELKIYIFSEGLEAGFTKLTVFDFASYTETNSTQLVAFFGVTDVAELNQGQIREFMVKEGWKFGINLSDFVAAEDIELYRTENEALLKELFGEDVDVSTLSAELVLDVEFGGLTQLLDVDFYLNTFVAEGGDVAAAFGVDSIAQVTKLQVCEYLYSQETLEGVELSAFKVSSYVGENKDAIAEALKIDVKEVAKLDYDEIVEFMLGEGVELDLSLEGFVADGYFETTYAAAIAASGKDVLTWLAEDYKGIDADFIGYQFEQLTEVQQTDILTGLGIELAEGASLSVKQWIDIAYSAEFKAVLEVEEVKLSAIDIEGYRTQYEEELKDCFAAPGIKIKSGSKKFKSGSLKFGKSGSLKAKSGSGSLKFGSGSKKLKGDKSMKLKSKSLKAGTGKLKSGQLASVDEFDVTTLTDKQVLEFMFDKGVELGIDPLEFVEVDYLKSEFTVKIAEHYGIEITAVADLSDGLVVDALYGGLSNEIDYEFVRTTYEAELTSKFAVAIEKVTDFQILEYVYEVGADTIDITPVDIEGFVEANGEAIAQELGVNLEDLPTFSYEDVFAFIFKQGVELGLNLEGFVNFEYYQAEFSQNIVFNYREENVFSVGGEAVFDFFNSSEASVGLSASPIYDPEWYRTEYATILTEQLADIDTDANGEIDDVELEAFATGAGLEQGLETSDDYDFDTDFSDAEVEADLLTHYGVASIEEVTFAQKVEYMVGQGLEDGYIFSGLQAIKDNPDNEEQLLNKTGAASLDQIAATQLYQVASELALF